MNDLMNFDDFSLADNPDPRSPLVLILDASSSMVEKRPGDSRSPMDALNSGLDVLISELNKDPLAKRRVEVSVVAFGSQVAPATPFATVDNLSLPILEPMGITSMGAAVNVALDALEARKKTYKENGISYFRPIAMLITDGLATDSIDDASKRIRIMSETKKVTFMPIAVEGADIKALEALAGKSVKKLSELKFNELFIWLSASLTSVSNSQPGDKVLAPPTDDWAEL